MGKKHPGVGCVDCPIKAPGRLCNAGVHRVRRRCRACAARNGVWQRVAAFAPELHARYHQLARRYDLTHLDQRLARKQWDENLFVLDVLDRHLAPESVRGPGLEIGCRNFSYLPALNAYAATPWHGVELDGRTRYWKGAIRAAYGRGLAARYPGCGYHVGSVMDLSDEYALIVWFRPCVHPGSPLAYGASRRIISPLELLAKAHQLLRPSGTMLIVNQGPVERDEQQRLCSELALPASLPQPVDSMFSPFRRPQFVTCIITKSSPRHSSI